MELNFKKFMRAFNKTTEGVGSPVSPISPLVPETPRSANLQDLKLTSLSNTRGASNDLQPIVHASLEDMCEYPNDPHAEQEVLESIESKFFDADYDAARFEIENTVDFSDTSAIDRRCKQLAYQKHVVSKKVSEKVLAKQTDCANGVAKVSSICSALSEIVLIIRHSRNALKVYHSEITGPAMEVVRFHHQRNEIYCILQSLYVLKALHEADSRVQELLEEGQLAMAVKILVEAQATALTYSQFNCVRKLNAKVNDTLLAIKDIVEKRLSQLCTKFDEQNYLDLMQAYWKLGECHYVIDQLHLHVLATIRNRSAGVVGAFAQFSQMHDLYSEQQAKVTVASMMKLSGGEALFGNGEAKDLLGLSSEDIRFMPYQDMCRRVAPLVFTKCLLRLCQCLWDTLKSYHAFLNWHQVHDMVEELGEKEAASKYSKAEIDALYEYVREKLHRGPTRVWQEVQNKVSALVASSHLASFKFDEFLEVLDVIHRLMEIGDELCSKTEETGEGHKAMQHHMLQESLRQQSALYLKNYHLQRMDELRTFLENELWEPCPLRPGFSVFQMEEFKFLKRIKVHTAEATGRGNASLTVSFLPFIASSANRGRLDASVASESDSYFAVYAEHGSNPFQMLESGSSANVTVAEISEVGQRRRAASTTLGYSDVEDYEGGSSDDDVADELKKDFVDEGSGDEAVEKPETKIAKKPAGLPKKASEEEPKFPPLLPNTSLALLRLCGKYLQLLLLLRPVAFDVLVCIAHLFEFYIYSVCKFFAPDLYEHVRRPDPRLDPLFCIPEASGAGVSKSAKLVSMLKRIQDNIVLVPAEESPSGSAGTGTSTVGGGEEVNSGGSDERNDRSKFSPPELHIGASVPDPMVVLSRAVVAGESVAFIASQYQALRQHFQAHIPNSRRPFVDQFFSKSVAMAPELRDPLFSYAARQNINSGRVLQLMGQINWDVHDMMDSYNTYVDVLLRELQVFSMRLDELVRVTPVSPESKKLLWFHAVRHSVRLFVEGFAVAKKCSFYGRSWMLLDFRQFLQKLSRFADLNPIPDCPYVEEYLRAYYKSDIEIEDWIKSHAEYCPSHIASLVGCMPHLSKKARQLALALVGEGEIKSQVTSNVPVGNN